MSGTLLDFLSYFIKSYSSWLWKFVLLYTFYRWDICSSHASQTETTHLNTKVNTKGRKRTLLPFWNWLFWYQAESAEFSSVSCFQEGFALGAPMSVATANLSFWKETFLGLKGCFEKFLEFRGEMFKMPGRNNKWSLFSHRLIRCGCAWWLGLRKHVRGEWKRVGVTSREEKQGKEEWVCVGNIVRFWNTLYDTDFISCLPTGSLFSCLKIMCGPGFVF